MNLDLLKFWGIAETINDEEWNDFYIQKLFELKKMVLDQIFLPKLLRKRWDDCLTVVQYQFPNKKIIYMDTYHFQSLAEFEIELSNIKLTIHQCKDFEDLAISILQILAALESYRKIFEDFTLQWGDEWKSVEVNSREVFPSGLFLHSLKNGKNISDWKDSLLKERKRITIVF